MTKRIGNSDAASRNSLGEQGATLFERLSPEALAECESCFHDVRLPAGACIFDEGDAADSMFVIRTGLVDIVPDKDSPERLAVLGPGESFGEQSLLSGCARSAAAVTRTSTVLMRLDHADFLAVLASVPDMGAAVAAVLSDRLRTTSRLAMGVKPGLVILLSDHDRLHVRSMKSNAPSSLLDAPSSSPSTSSLLDAPSSSPLPLALSLVDAAMQLATSCATLRGQAAVVRPADGQHPELGTPDEGLVSPRSPEDLEGFGDENKHDEVVVLPAPSGSVADAAVRMARDYSVVIVPVAREALETSGGAGHGLLDACDWHVLVGESGSEEEPGRRPGTLVASMTHDQKSVDRVARLICRRRVGVALGSGSIRGFAHGGVLSVLEDQQIPIDFLAGSSAGAIAGSLYLRGNDPREFADIGKALREAARTGLPSLSGISAKAIFSGRRLRNYLAKALGRDTTFEDLPVPFVVAATDLEAGGPVHIESGSLVEAVSASAAMPGVFPPVTIEGRRLGDGGTTDPVPVSALRALGADVVVAVNVMNVSSGFLGTTPSRIPIPIPSLVENLFMGIDSITSQIAVESCRLADIVVTPTAPDTRWFDVLPFRAYETAGREAMTLALPELCALLGRS